MMKILYSTLLFLLITSNATAQGKWTKKLDLPDSVRIEACSFSANGKGYLVAGRHANNYFKDVWEFDPTNNTWTQKNNFGGAARREAVAFAINGKGYVGTGRDAAGAFKDFWEYDPTTDTWTKKADYPGGVRRDATGFSIVAKGYIGTGQDPNGGVNKTDFWEYDPTTDKWTQKTSFAGVARNAAIGFSIGNKGYIGLGRNSSGSEYGDLWEFDPANNTWTQRTSFTAGTREEVVSFTIGNLAYIGTGYSAVTPAGNKTDFWTFDPKANSWTKMDSLNGVARQEATSFEIGGKGYIATGYGAASAQKDLWEYDPSTTNIGINQATNNTIILYPNPVNKQITIELDRPLIVEEISIHIYTAEGKECPTPAYKYILKENGFIYLETDNLSNGIYILNVHIPDKVMSIKVVVAK